MSTRSKHRKPRGLPNIHRRTYIYLAVVLASVGALTILFLLHPLAMTVGTVIFTYLQYKVRQLNRHARKSVRKIRKVL